jgi:tetratricopeptide (TPR) repeat protein
MALCAKCNAELSNDAVFCTECGERVEISGQEAPEPAETERLIAAANLQRTRGEYSAAIGQCTEILRQDAENPTVYCLLGDIYAEQDNVEQAVRWYQMACEIDPDSRGCAERPRPKQKRCGKSALLPFGAYRGIALAGQMPLPCVREV